MPREVAPDRHPVIRWLGRPVFHVAGGFERCLDHGMAGLVILLAGLVVGWFVYVPLHELLHALACLATGGTVERLEIAPLYGGHLLAKIFPWVVAEGEYAGRLAGFDTGGNDLVYLATVFGPYLLTLFPGVWALRAAGQRAGERLPAAAGFGFWLPWALAPFLSLPGDAYEIGSIVVTRLPPWSAAADLLRGDDVALVAREITAAGSAAGHWWGFALGVLAGVIWAYLTYHLASWIARQLLPAGPPEG